MKQAVQNSCSTALGTRGRCSNVNIIVNRRMMLAVGTATVTFTVESNDPNISSTLDTVLTDGTISQQLAIQGYTGYTFTAVSITPQSSSSSTGTVTNNSRDDNITNTGVIAGIVVGGFAALVLAAGLIYYWYRSNDLNIKDDEAQSSQIVLP